MDKKVTEDRKEILENRSQKLLRKIGLDVFSESIGEYSCSYAHWIDHGLIQITTLCTDPHFKDSTPIKFYTEKFNGIVESINAIINAFLENECESIEPKKIDIGTACQYLRSHIDPKLVIYHNDTWCSLDEFIERFKKSMEEQE